MDRNKLYVHRGAENKNSCIEAATGVDDGDLDDVVQGRTTDEDDDEEEDEEETDVDEGEMEEEEEENTLEDDDGIVDICFAEDNTFIVGSYVDEPPLGDKMVRVVE